MLKDHGIITRTDRLEVIDASKIKREKKRICKSVVEERDEQVQNITCIGLDGKQDKGSLGK